MGCRTSLIKKELKILLICSVAGLIFGIIIGVNSMIADFRSNVGAVESMFGPNSGITVQRNTWAVFQGIWFGTGIGGAIAFLPQIPSFFMKHFKEEGLKEAIKTIFFGCIGWLFLFALGGLVAFFVRVTKKKRKIKKLRMELAQATT